MPCVVPYSTFKGSECRRRLKFDPPGVRRISWNGYVVMPRRCRYSTGLKTPREILIRFWLYQRMYEVFRYEDRINAQVSVSFDHYFFQNPLVALIVAFSCKVHRDALSNRSAWAKAHFCVGGRWPDHTALQMPLCHDGSCLFTDATDLRRPRHHAAMRTPAARDPWALPATCLELAIYKK